MSSANRLVPPYDFRTALETPLERRMEICVEKVRTRLLSANLWNIIGFPELPPVPDGGASDTEIQQLALDAGVPLPYEYQCFLSRWRYLIIDDGLRIWGVKCRGVGIGSPWLSDRHRAGTSYLVFADYGGYADGDQLMFDLTDPTQPVIAYLHEHGPLYEVYAPSFSLALWRMVEEWNQAIEQ